MEFDIKGFFKRNKKLLLISLIIFLLFTVAGAVITFMAVGDDYGQITESINNLSSSNASTSTENAEYSTFTLYLFSHNLVADLITIMGGLFFSIPSVLIAIYNAVSIGGAFGADLTFSSVSILPHGIIEYAATVFALAAAFNITKLEVMMIKNRSFKKVLKENKILLKDILIMIIIVVVLVVIAAIIEANVTPLITEWYFGI